MAFVIYIPYPGLYDKTHIQSVYNAIRRKLKSFLLIALHIYITYSSYLDDGYKSSSFV